MNVKSLAGYVQLAEPTASTPELLRRLSPRQLELLKRELREREDDLPSLRLLRSLEQLRELPLSAGQRRLWTLDRLSSGGTSYNLWIALRLFGPLEIGCLERAIAAVARRHEVLRTTFAWRDSEPVQIVHRELRPGWALVDLSGLPAAAREEVLRRLGREQIALPFDLERGPLLRGILLRLASGEHAVLATVHHIAFDGWSARIFLQEIAAFYTAFQQGRLPRLPELPVQYGDFALWQRRYAGPGTLRAQAAYWREALREAPRSLRLPADRPLESTRGLAGASLRITLEPELAAALRELARRRGVTLFTLLVAGFGALLGRLSGQEDLLLGTPVSQRSRGELEGLIGFFVNTLALRLRPEAGTGFRRFLDDVRETVLGAQTHQEIPFEEVMAEVFGDRTAAASPVQVLLGLLSLPGKPLQIPGLLSRGIDLEMAEAPFPLALNLEDRGEGISGRIDYRAAVFDRTTIRRFAERFRILLQSAAAEPDRLIGDLPLLSACERHQVLLEWTGTGGERPEGGLVGALVEAWAAAAPDAVAVASGSRFLTYRALAALSGRRARALQWCGIGPEVVVGICVEPSLELIVGLLAVLQAGGAYLPLEPSWPRQRLMAMVEETQAPLLLTARGAADGLAPAWVEVLDLERPAGDARPDLQPPRIEQDTLAYVIYTSGSTGRPKGVQLTHGGLCNLVREQIRLFGIHPGDRILQLAPLCFDASVSEIFLALASGATLHLEPREALLPGPELVEALDRLAISVATLPPSLLSSLPAADLPDLRVLIVAGEVCPPDLVETWGRGRRLFNAYGPTEATVCATAEACEPGQGSPPIGRPLARTRAHLLTADLRPVPLGAVGELWLGGVSLARGYCGRPDLTAERFVPDPVGGLTGDRLYRTGDLARFLADGRLECLGRRDLQVKIRGVRIETGEIEAVLRRHPAVTEAVVTVRERPSGGDRALVAYVAAAGREPSPGELRGFVAAVLPAAMVPPHVVVLAALPRTAQGKVDRAALPWQETVVVAGGEAPRNALEGLLLELWAAVLRQEDLGIDDDFFGRGGDSITSIQIAARARKRGLALEPRQIFEAPTVRTLAASLERGGSADAFPAPPEEPSFPEAAETEVLPLTPAQHGMLFFHLFAPESRAYFLQAACAIQGDLDTGALRRTWEALLARHPALRAAFVWDETARPFQKVPRHVDLSWREEDWRDRSAESQREAWERLLLEDREQGIDLARAPVMRWTLVRCGESSWRFLWTWHHILLDGWSVNVLTREGLHLYQTFRRGGTPDLRPAPSYSAYFSWLRRQDRSRAEEFWRGLCAGMPPAGRLPMDRERTATPPAVTHVRSHHARVPSAALRAFAAAHGLTLSTLIEAAWALLLSRFSGRDDVLFGITTSGRPAAVPDVEDLVGLFINTLPLRLRLPAAAPVLRWLHGVRDLGLAAREHEHCPLPDIQEWIGEPGPRPLCESLVIFQNHPARVEPPGSGAPGFSVSEMRSFNHTSHPLVLLAVPGRDLLLEIAWDPRRFDAATVRRLQAHLRCFLEALISAPEARLGDLDALPPAERQQLLLEWNDAAGEDEPLLIPQRFARIAAARPDAAAVEGRDGCLTYGALGRGAQGLARRLRRLGVGPEVRVGVLLDGDSDLVVALLAVLAAGGAYVPLDPADPDRRTAEILEDSGASLLLTREPADRAPEGRWRILRLGSRPRLDPGDDPKPLPALAGPDNLACVMYTSGTGGVPKGVMVRHGALAGYIAAAADRFGVGPDDRVLQLARIGFDTSAEEMLTCLTRGATLVLRSHRLAEAAPVFARFCAEREITVLDLPTAYWSALTEGLAGGRPAEAPPPPSVRLLVIGGERASAEALHRWRSWSSGRVRLINTYGPTEATIVASWWELPPGDGPVPVVPIGRPVPGARIHLLDGLLRPVPVEAPGEVWIAGAGLARGYLGRPELTAGQFLPDPFADAPGARLYRTGDLARRRLDGTLEFLARLDRQVKIRGVRIEPDEVEAALLALPGVQQAVVTVRSEGEELCLVAFLVPRDGAGLDPGRLRELLRERLPAPMLPADLILLERLPLTPNGKIDRRALVAPAAAESSGAAAPPRTPVEEVVAAVWSEVLGRDVGIRDDFFAVGGHSLRAMQVISRLRRAFGVELTVRDLFDHPTVAGLAARVERARRQGLTAGLPPLVRALAPGAARPLSYAQQRLWFLDRLEPGGIAYNVPMNARLTGPVDAAALDAALREIARRHEILRTRYEEVDGTPVQVIEPAASWPGLAIVDLASLPAAERRAEARRLMREEAAAPLDLRRGPVFRARLLWLDEPWLVSTVHHIACDEWSGRILLRELTALHDAFHRRLPSPFDDLPVQYADYAVWQRSWTGGESLAGQLAYWRRRLAGAPAVVELPADRPRPPVQTFRGARRPVCLAPRGAEGLRALARRQEATPFMVGLALFQTLLRSLCGSRDISVGTPISGRGQVEVEGLIGLFLNLLVLRVEGGEEASFLDLVLQVRDRCLEAYAHQDVPFERLVEELAPKRSLGHSPLVQVMFVLLQGGRPAAAEDRRLPALESVARFDLSLILLASDAGLSGVLEHNTDLFDASTAARWCAALESLAEAVVEEPERPLAELGLLREPQRRQLLLSGGEPPAAPAAPSGPRDLLELALVELWEEVLERGPVRVTDDFFELGGHSLLAIRLLSLVRRRFGRDLPLSDLFRGATVEHMAHLLRSGTGPAARRPLVAMSLAGDEPPFFWVHPVGGNVLCYAELARALPPCLPVYAFQSPAPGPCSIGEMAELYLEELLAVRPEGPYRLGGWSMGGLIAFEMAGRLLRQGRSVEMLALLDTHLPTRPDDRDERAWVTCFAEDLAATLGRSLPRPADPLPANDPLGHLFIRLQEAGLIPSGLELDEVRELYGIFRSNTAVLAAFQPARYPGRITLVRAGRTPAGPRPDFAAAWAALAGGGIDTLEVAAGHYEILRAPAVETIARFLDDRLGRGAGLSAQS